MNGLTEWERGRYQWLLAQPHLSSSERSALSAYEKRINPRQYVSVQPRQAGKTFKQAMDDVLAGSSKDMAKKEYVLRDGTRVDEAHLAAASVITLEAMHHRMQKTHPVGPLSAPNRQEVRMPGYIDEVTNGTIVTWKSRGIFTYAAVKAGDNWYITGSGEFYGKNEFNHNEFTGHNVLRHPDVSDIQIVTDLLPLTFN